MVRNREATGKVLLDGNSLTLEGVYDVSRNDREVDLAKDAREQIESSRKTVEQILKSRKVVYGITTGFGKFKDVFIDPGDSETLQRNFLRSHAAGTGPSFDRDTVRAITLLRANALAKGFSGIRLSVVRMLLSLLNEKIHPLVPEQGSVGSSGDLAPLSHLALVLVGEGEAEVDGKIYPGKKALRKRGLDPVTLLAKEGLALTNGTQAMTGVGALVVKEAEQLAKTADIIGAMTLESLLGTDTAFREDIHEARPHPGQLASAINLRTLLAESELIESHADCDMVQDAYSIRCMPQVHGATRQALAHARQVLEIEINAATDNPLIFGQQVYSAGNFHGQPVALVMDYVAAALSELANISERRTERLVNPHLSNGLPAFLTRNGGLNSGLMIAQYSAASLVSENKSLAHPASVDSIPTSANQEDHVSMGTIASRKARDILANLKTVLGIELLCALQALDLRTGRNQTGEPRAYLREGIDTMGKRPGVGIRRAYETARKHLKYLDEDRLMADEIKSARALVESGELVTSVEELVGTLA